MTATNAQVDRLDPCARSAKLVTLDDACVAAARFAKEVGGDETLPIGDAQGRVLASAVSALVALPPFDQSAMDGYALAASGVPAGRARLGLAGRVAAGEAAGGVPVGHVARIFTGAPLPDGCDTVVMQEHVVQDGSAVVVEGPVRIGSNVRRCGEDVLRGAVLMRAGEVVGPRHVAMLAAQGLGTVAVRRRPRLSILSTGHELRQAGERLDGTAVYDANRPMLMALARSAGADAMDRGHLGDEPRALAEALTGAAATSDLVVTSGGASVGEEDHCASALRMAGAEFEILRIAVKPGKPAVVGQIGGCAVLCLPGNPGAALVSWMTLGGAMLAAMTGRSFRLRATARIPSLSHHRRSPGRREFAPARIVDGSDGPTLEIVAKGGSGRIGPLLEADGFADLDPGTTDVRPGDLVAFHSFSPGIEAWVRPDERSTSA